MGSATFLECFARSWRVCKLPRPLRFLRPFQPIRCHPEATPPRRWQCTYGGPSEQGPSNNQNVSLVFLGVLMHIFGISYDVLLIV